MLRQEIPLVELLLMLRLYDENSEDKYHDRKSYSRHTRKNKCITKDTTKGGEVWKVLKILIGMLKIS